MRADASEAVARALEPVDPQCAALIRAQAQRLRLETSEHRALEAALLAESWWPAPGYRPQFDLYDLFGRNVTVLEAAGAHAWVYDDDIVSLVDGPKEKSAGDPWERNVVADRELRALWETPVAARLDSLRLVLFEGLERMGKTFGELGAGARVTHLELRLQRDEVLRPVTEWFPSLRALTCSVDRAEVLLRDGAPALRTLVVGARSGVPAFLDFITAGLPELRHLGLYFAVTSADRLGEIAGHAITSRLESLDLFSINDAPEFPFDAVLAARARLGHLRRLVLPGHQVPDAIRARFAHWPEVTFASHDRRELIAFDIETKGWPDSSR